MSENHNRPQLVTVKIGKSVEAEPIALTIEKNSKRKVPILPLRFSYKDNDQDTSITIGLCLDHVEKLHTDLGRLLLQHKHLLH